MCARAFGHTCEVQAIQELGGGEMNNAYRITLAQGDVVLRVAPANDHPLLFKHERDLLRTEYAVQPFLAPLGPLVPSMLMADFTHQIINRDYLFQPYIEGRSWRDMRIKLTPETEANLWRELGEYTRLVHNVKGVGFGSPTMPLFTRWGEALLGDLESMIRDLEERQISTTEVRLITNYLEAHLDLFDTEPRLLHGDMWLQNILVREIEGQNRIVGVLDASFAHWGDPAADWTLMRLTLNPPEGSQPFWEVYGKLPQDEEAQVRFAIYQARSLATSLLELDRIHYEDTARLWQDLARIEASLRKK